MNDIIGLTITGIVSGLLAGFVGAGSEILIIPLLTFFGVFNSVKTRIGTSLFMLLPPIGLFAVMKFYKKGYVNIYYGLYLALVFTLFSYVSTLYSINLDDKLLKKIFAIFTILTGFYMLFSKHMDNNC
tara:strand:+ start:3600 stop:3983 length:384 start_codon:yes stop_codon:yes gene_type:complete